MSSKRLLYDFDTSYLIQNNCASQNLQDIFALSMLEGKQFGSYLEIGAGPPIEINNTFLLSTVFNWSGVSIEWLDQGLVEQWKTTRPKDNFLQCDALTLDYRELLVNNYPSNIIDYLQLDIDPSINTLTALKRLPLDDFKFRVITFETDVYVGDTRARTESREILSQHGYELVVGDVLIGGQPFEDWWAHPDLVDNTILKEIQARSFFTQNPYHLLLI